jgi:hypothetical protein
MSAEPEADIISWQDAVCLLAELGIDEPARKLRDAVVNRLVRHYPPTTLALNWYLFDETTGVLRMHKRDDNPRHLSVVRDDLDKHFKLRDAANERQTSNAYMPEYLALILQAIRRFGISDENQPKVEELRGWFCAQIAGGEKVSKNLARAMATIVRRADRKKGRALPHRRKG